MALQRLYDAVESSKLELSNKLSSRINIPFISASATGPIHMDETYSKAAFENVARPSVSKLTPAIVAFVDAAIARHQANRAAGTGTEAEAGAGTGAEVPLRVSCLLVGGGARIVCVREEVASAVASASKGQGVVAATHGQGIAMLVPLEPEEVIINGAAALSKYSST
jgi:molecular chaperone DnaK (HSP70)